MRHLAYLLAGLGVILLASCSQLRPQNPIDAAIDQDVVQEIKSLRAEQ